MRNLLLATLPDADFALLRPHLDHVLLNRHQVLIDYDTPIEHVYFVESGLASMITASPDGHVVETAMVGREGLVGVSLLLCTDRIAAKLFVQIEGTAWRIGADRFGKLIEESRSLQRSLLRFVQTLFQQMAYTALSNASHTIEERLARWLLMAHDRVDGDELFLTHEFFALMLDVRRSGVTLATHVLEGMGLIRAKRGCITILDRAGLEDLAIASYGVPETEYARLIAPLRKSAAAVA